MATLDIVTRHMPSRAHLLARLKAQLDEQTSDDFVHTVIVDADGIGINNAGRLLAGHETDCAYVWVLDDDDMLTHNDAIRQMVERLEIKQPDIMFVHFDHERWGVLPDRYHWYRKPEIGRIGGSSIIASRDLWELCRDAWGSGRYESDFDFIDACYKRAFVIDWYDITPAGMDKQRMGAAA